jgi:hypothetical protein
MVAARHGSPPGHIIHPIAIGKSRPRLDDGIGVDARLVPQAATEGPVTLPA